MSIDFCTIGNSKPIISCALMVLILEGISEERKEHSLLFNLFKAFDHKSDFFFLSKETYFPELPPDNKYHGCTGAVIFTLLAVIL